MKIQTVSCTQFAGVRDRSVSFAEGINVIYGKNESGKSTLVNLIARTLFQSSHMDLRKDKDFHALYFPSARKGNTTVGDFVDGKITFETPEGTFTLSKEWGDEARCTLSTPDGVLRDRKKIEAVLSEVLLYGEGVYGDLIFSSQRNSDISLQSILDATKKSGAKQEIARLVSQAFAESDGISVDAIEGAILKKIEEIAGKHWDEDRNQPARKAGRWANGLGEILKAYYALEDAEAELEKIADLEQAVDRTAAEYVLVDADTAKAEAECEKFSIFANRLAVRAERQKNIENLESALKRWKDVLNVWPGLAQRVKRAKVLEKEKNDRELLDKYEKARAIVLERDGLDTAMLHRPCPTMEEVTRAKKALRQLERLENKLCGMNLNAAIEMLGGNTVEVVSLLTGQPIDVSGGLASITEAVSITVPGIMRMQLTPADVNVEIIQGEMEKCREILGVIFEKYGVTSVSELERLAGDIVATKQKLDNIQHRLTAVLGAMGYEELEAAVGGITETVRDKETIAREILTLCGSGDVTRYVTVNETVLQGYEDTHGTLEQLKARAFDLAMELEQARATLAGSEDIPTEYLAIADPESYLDQLRNALKLKQKDREDAFSAKATAAGKLESHRQMLSGDPTEQVMKARQTFEEQKSLLRHWRHILQVFYAQKENLHSNPMVDIAQRFTEYLGLISAGRVSSEFPEADKLNMQIYSDNRQLDYGKLSEGTKETVSLAFRLAVLDHLFPDGGVIVFDDPFVNMDEQRMEQACALLKACAERHQVIFLTCREEYLARLGGNTIRI